MFKFCSIEISFRERLQFIYRVVLNLCGIKKLASRDVLADKYFFLSFFAVVTDLNVK